MKYSWKKLTSDQIIRYIKNELSGEELEIVRNLIDDPVNKDERAALENTLRIEQTIEQMSYEEALQKVTAAGVQPKTPTFPLSSGEPAPKQIWEVPQIIADAYGNKTYIADTHFVYLLTPFEYPFENDILENQYPEFAVALYLPISFDIEHAQPTDIIFRADNPYFGIPFMIQTGIEASIMKANVTRFIKEMSAEEAKTIFNFYSKSNNMKYDPEYLKGVIHGPESGNYEQSEYLEASVEGISFLQPNISQLEELAECNELPAETWDFVSNYSVPLAAQSGTEQPIIKSREQLFSFDPVSFELIIFSNNTAKLHGTINGPDNTAAAGWKISIANGGGEVIQEFELTPAFVWEFDLKNKFSGDYILITVSKGTDVFFKKIITRSPHA